MAKQAPQTSTYDGPWIADGDELNAMESIIVMRELGIDTQADIPNYGLASMALVAVLIARRDRPEIPLEHWKTLKMRDITQPDKESGELPTTPAT